MLQTHGGTVGTVNKLDKHSSAIPIFFSINSLQNFQLQLPAGKQTLYKGLANEECSDGGSDGWERKARQTESLRCTC